MVGLAVAEELDGVGSHDVSECYPLAAVEIDTVTVTSGTVALLCAVYGSVADVVS